MSTNREALLGEVSLVAAHMHLAAEAAERLGSTPNPPSPLTAPALHRLASTLAADLDRLASMVDGLHLTLHLATEGDDPCTPPS